MRKTLWLIGLVLTLSLTAYGGQTSPSPGSTWTLQTSASYPLNGVAYGNGTFVAVGEDGTILTSRDGRNWTRQTSGTSKDLDGVAYGNGTFVAVGKYGTTLTSP